MADVLSQNEVESLLSALDPSASSGSGGGASRPSTRATDFNAQISIYDFKRPERVSKEQMRAFRALHESFSREFGAALSGMLRSIIEVKLMSVDQLTYSEFVFSLENPTCFNLLESETLDGHIILDISPSIIFPIIDRLLGGDGHSQGAYPNRALTEIEVRLVSRITGLAIEGIESAWSNLCEWKLSVSQVESNPQLVQIVPPNEVIVLISFEVTMGETRGIINLCIPFNTIEPISSKLTSDSWSAYKKKTPDLRQQLNLEASVTQSKINMKVDLDNSKLTAGEVLNLAVGDVIMCNKGSAQSLTVELEGSPVFTAFPGVYKGHKAISIESMLAMPKDIVEEKIRNTDSAQGVGSS
ncbi:MAG: flagellar motor switch protein FliM [Planctomycetes bacterium]|nr:flagellar motor switch protein FliM [Planctomycetota bacterium]MCH9726237.1 flagellar motor switch protein FliM [Planctomycetota bacterium]MCH9775742.1 flagellar motor switch protein FliM [Planctomycetota bacterium]MCH9791780.1 flagellar motor switch protein FliM [Planctomycetota bacterium]